MGSKKMNIKTLESVHLLFFESTFVGLSQIFRSNSESIPLHQFIKFFIELLGVHNILFRDNSLALSIVNVHVLRSEMALYLVITVNQSLNLLHSVVDETIEMYCILSFSCRSSPLTIIF